MSNSKTFRLGITMAGAVSAGAYTAGAMDYLFETLTKWEKAKQAGDPRIPQHQVLIEALGGASAGGMTAAISLMALQNKIPKVEDTDLRKTGNLLFDLWVNMMDDEEESTLEKMLYLDDISREKGVPCLLNSKAIGDLARIAGNAPRGKLPAFISPNLDLLLTLCNLRGIPLDIEFSMRRSLASDSPSHKLSLHRLLAHFRMNLTDGPNGSYLPLDLDKESDVKLLIDCAQATGAFPFGLESCLIDHEYFSADYVKASSLRFLKVDDWKDMVKIEWRDLPDPFITQVIDGGTTNNEPFGEVAEILEEKAEMNGNDSDPEFRNYGLIMIDPFPNFVEESEEYIPPDNLKDLAMPILEALRQQAIFKGQDFVETLSGDYPRGMIFPVRWKNPSVWSTEGKKYPYPIACSALEGFGGFFSRELRVHDYLLGRWNCRNFLRYFFCFPVGAKLHPIHQSWSDEMKNVFRFKNRQGKYFLPIIPDVSKLEKPEEEEPKFFEYDFDYPRIDPDEIMQYRILLEDRFEEVLRILQYQLAEARESKDPGRYLNDYYRQNWFIRNISSGLENWITRRKIIPILAKKGAKEALGFVLADFHNRGLIDFEQ